MSGTVILIPVTNAIEALNSKTAPRRQNQRTFSL